MKYYAVTEDPNELFHYGVKGMKWGQHIFGDKPKSPGYKRALGKLRASAAKQTKVPKSVKIEQRQERKLQREQDRYAKAVQKAQRNMELVQNLNNIDSARKYERGIDKEYWSQVKAARAENRQNRKYDKVERHMNKYIQQARQGKLKYGKLSDDQVQRVTERINMERNARQLGSAEKTWRQQKKEAFRKGKLSGIERGTAAAMEEVAKAGTIYGIQNLMNRRKRNALAKQQGKELRIKNREQNKKSHRDIVNEIKDEAFETRVREGQGVIARNSPVYWQKGEGLKLQKPTAASQAKYLKGAEERKHEAQRIQNVQDRLANERDENWQRYLNDNGFKNEKEATKAFVKRLKIDASDAANKGNTKKANEIIDQINDIEKSHLTPAGKKAQSEFNRNAMLKSTKSSEDQKRSALAELSDVQKSIRKANQIDAINKAAIENWAKAIGAWNSNPNRPGNPPPKPTVKNGMLIAMPTVKSLSPEAIKILQEMNVPLPNTNGGGGKKK